jgi:MoxR-like ATPase
MTDFQVLTPLPADYDWRAHDQTAPRGRLDAVAPPKDLTSHEEGARAYRPDPDLILAINAAIQLRAPLLVTGDPGTGKTQLAYFLGLYFGIQVFSYTVRSTSTARDLRYDFDAVAYLREAYLAQAGHRHASDATAGSAAPSQTAPSGARHAADADPRMRHIERGPLWLAFEQPEACLVLIDEIDKAPRDFPNDLLQELDKQEFPHPFSARPEDAIRAARDRLPLVLVTSNNERRLPDAFLRRCIVHHIAMTPALIERAVAAHGAAFPALSQAVRDAAIAQFEELRREDRLSRKPGIAELLAWLVTLARARPDIGAQALKTTPLGALPHLHCLVKVQEDVDILKEPARR